MISAYQSIITYEDGEWQDYLEKIALIDIFGGLLKEYPDKGDFKCIVRYILLAYSVESDMLVLGADWTKTKRKIFERCGIKPEKKFYEDLVHLKNRKVLEAIHKWLEYSDEDTFTQICILKDLRVEMQMTCLSDIKKASGELDFDQKYRNSQYSVDLKKSIKDLESELIQNSVLLKDSIKEYREGKKSAKSFGMETMLKETP